MQIVIEIPEEDFEHVKLVAEMQKEEAGLLITPHSYTFIANGVPLPKGHGRLIDADAFIDGLRDSSKRQRYNECLINEFLTVDDVFQAVIESLENKGLAEGDTPTIIEADKEEADGDSN